MTSRHCAWAIRGKSHDEPNIHGEEQAMLDENTRTHVAAQRVAHGTLLRTVMERNPALIEAAFKLHRDRVVPPNSFVFDLDAVAANADALSAEASARGLTTYVMTKQYS